MMTSDLPYAIIATDTLFRRYRIRLWEWPEPMRRKVMLAALDAIDGDEEGVRAAVEEKAKEVLNAATLYFFSGRR